MNACEGVKLRGLLFKFHNEEIVSLSNLTLENPFNVVGSRHLSLIQHIRWKGDLFNCCIVSTSTSNVCPWVTCQGNAIFQFRPSIHLYINLFLCHADID